VLLPELRQDAPVHHSVPRQGQHAKSQEEHYGTGHCAGGAPGSPAVCPSPGRGAGPRGALSFQSAGSGAPALGRQGTGAAAPGPGAGLGRTSCGSLLGAQPASGGRATRRPCVAPRRLSRAEASLSREASLRHLGLGSPGGWRWGWGPNSPPERRSQTPRASATGPQRRRRADRPGARPLAQHCALGQCRVWPGRTYGTGIPRVTEGSAVWDPPTLAPSVPPLANCRAP